MAYTVSNNFRTAIKDGSVPKSCLVVFDDLYFSTEDFTGAVVFDQYFNTSEDLTFGDCPSDTLSFSIVANGMLAGYSFGRAKAYLGVQTASETYTFGDINAHIEVNGETFTASETGLYHGDTLIDSGVYLSLLSDGTTLWASGETSAVSVNLTTFAVSDYAPNRFMAEKLKSGLSAVFASNTATVWDGANVITYEYVPMGVYNIEKPRSTVANVVTVSDAHDDMAKFDVDASEFISSLTFPQTLGQIYTALCNYVEVEYESATFENSTTSYSTSPFTDASCKCRDILSWIAESAYCIAHMNRIGQMSLRWVGNVEESIGATDISQKGYSMAEYITAKVTGVLLKSTSGTTLSFGSMRTPYPLYANPFVSTISDSALEHYTAIPTFVPMELGILECDPSIDTGDIINVQPLVDDHQILTDNFGVAYAEWQEWVALYGHDDVVVGNAQHAYGIAKEGYVAFAKESPIYPVPLMQRTITYNSGISATYSATGNAVRDIGDEDIAYNANVAAQKAVEKIDNTLTQQEVFNRLTNNGQTQGIYLQDGKIYINAAYIATGILASPNGKFSLDMITGTINMANANITGGTINIETAYGVSSILLKTEQTSYPNWSSRFFPAGVRCEYVQSSSLNPFYADYNGDGIALYYGSIPTDRRCELNYTGLIFYGDNHKMRVLLTADGLKFYDSNGTLTKTYSAT